MHRACGLRLDPNTGVRPEADKKLYLRLKVDKMHAFVALTETYLQSFGCSSTNFTTAFNCMNPNTEINHRSTNVVYNKTHVFSLAGN